MSGQVRCAHTKVPYVSQVSTTGMERDIYVTQAKREPRRRKQGSIVSPQMRSLPRLAHLQTAPEVAQIEHSDSAGGIASL